MTNVAIFASGEGSNAENLIRYFKDDTRVRIKLIVTNRDDAGVIARAEKHRKTVHIVSKAALENYTQQLIEFLKVEKIDLIILAGWLLKMPAAFIEAFPHRIINIHPSLLPRHGGKGMYGQHVHKAVISSGDVETGVTVHYVNEHYDDGEVILQARCNVEAGDTFETIAAKVQALEYACLPKAVEMVISGE